MKPVYRQYDGREFAFNDHVCVEFLLFTPDEERTGRLVQVRKKCGQFRSDVFLIRLRNGELRTFENAMIRHVSDKDFERSFYIHNGSKPPEIPPQAVNDFDAQDVTYTIGERFPEVGFIVENPSQPETPGCFTLAITKK